jgi:prolyl-tRNA synthetase
MAHSDDNGLVLPPRIAPPHIAIIPIYRDEQEHAAVMELARKVEEMFKGTAFDGIRVYTELDDRDLTSSERNWHWIKKGIPLRLEIGPRDVASQSAMVARRDKDPKDKAGVPVSELAEHCLAALRDMQQGIYEAAVRFRDENIVRIDDNAGFYDYFTPKNAEQPEIHGGFALTHWCGDPACEVKIKDDLKVTVRCIPFDAKEEAGSCVCCGKPSRRRVVFAKAY